jgi:hypothetical protein
MAGRCNGDDALRLRKALRARSMLSSRPGFGLLKRDSHQALSRALPCDAEIITPGGVACQDTYRLLCMLFLRSKKDAASGGELPEAA